MLNPLSRHKSPRTDDLPTGDEHDFESPTPSPDTAGYIGKNSFP
jgi:hypothetical protein